MTNDMDKKPQKNNLLMQYLSFAWQLIAGIAIFFYIGKLIDRWINTSTPLMIWIFPLLVIVAMLIKVIRDTSNKTND
jgi:F0F1-type ATP synthase assembly protein I